MKNTIVEEQTASYNVLKQDKEKGLTIIYERYGRKLYGYAVKNWKVTEDEAWDMVYKTLYKVVDAHKNYRFETEQKFQSFIFKIFMNYLRNLYRDKKKASENALFISFDNATVENGKITEGSIIEREVRGTVAAFNETEGKTDVRADSKQLDLLKEELDKMDEWQKILLLMRCQEISYREIAQYVDKPVTQLKVYYQRLKEKLTKRLNEKMIAANAT